MNNNSETDAKIHAAREAFHAASAKWNATVQAYFESGALDRPINFGDLLWALGILETMRIDLLMDLATLLDREWQGTESGIMHVEQHHLLPLMQEMIYSHFSQGPAAHSSLWGSKAYEDKIETEEALARARKQS